MISEILVLNCKKMQRDAQRKVYELLSPRLYRTCRRYLKHEEDIEEALADTFFIVFTKIDQLKDNAVFEGWARRIAVNQCLQMLRRKVNFNLYLDDVSHKVQPAVDAIDHLAEEDLMGLLAKIPAGCRTVFNLYVIEGYSHKEIAQMLQVSEGTSKSQLNAAKTRLKDLVNQLYYAKAR